MHSYSNKTYQTHEYRIGYGWVRERLAKGKAIPSARRQEKRTRSESDQERDRDCRWRSQGSSRQHGPRRTKQIVPCNGVFLSGHNVKCDKSKTTGESDAMKKVSYEECLALRNKTREGGASGGDVDHTDRSVVSGRCWRVLGVMLWSPLVRRALMGGLWWVICFLARLDGSPLTNLCSASRRCREYAFTALVERLGSTRFHSWPYTFHGAYDQVFRSAWKRGARKVIKASHIWFDIEELTNIIIFSGMHRPDWYINSERHVGRRWFRRHPWEICPEAEG